MSNTIPLEPDAGSVRVGTRPVATVPFGRRLAAVALIAGAAGNTAESAGLRAFLPKRPDGYAERLALVADHPVLSTALVVVGTLAIPFMIIGFLTMARFLRTAMPRIGLVAGLLLGAGMWGFLGLHVIGLAEVPLSAMADRAAAAAALQAIENSPVIIAVFLAPFFVGCVLGLVTLALGLLRSAVLPRWVPVALLAFIVIDFGTGPIGPIDPHWLFLAAAIGVAHRVLRSSDAEWASAAKGSAR
jgi:hypothetical protein